MTNLLCVGAAFGVLVATFQWGWGLDLVGLSTPYGTVPIASSVPLMMFAALFGLSMDYEVFLVSQIAQHHAAGEPPRQAVRSGLASSAKVIAAAAIIMISVFGSFISTATRRSSSSAWGCRSRCCWPAPWSCHSRRRC
ncbi:MAG TPA: MMPL family transporter [Actinomycetota bacterium]